MATHSNILAWRIPWTEELGRLYSPWGHKELDMTEQLNNSYVLRRPSRKRIVDIFTQIQNIKNLFLLNSLKLVSKILK